MSRASLRRLLAEKVSYKLGSRVQKVSRGPTPTILQEYRVIGVDLDFKAYRSRVIRTEQFLYRGEGR